MIKIFIAGGRAGPPDVVQEVLADLKNLLSSRRYNLLEVAFTVQHNFPIAILSLWKCLKSIEPNHSVFVIEFWQSQARVYFLFVSLPGPRLILLFYGRLQQFNLSIVFNSSIRPLIQIGEMIAPASHNSQRCGCSALVLFREYWQCQEGVGWGLGVGTILWCFFKSVFKMGKSKEGTEMINTKQEMTDMKMKKLIEKMPTHIKVQI